MSGKTALVLSGGGSRGALQVGLYQALHDLGIELDLIIGSSTGAVNGAFIAAGVPPAELARLWRSVQPKDFYALNGKLLRGPLRIKSLLDNRRLRTFLRRHLPIKRFEELDTPLVVTGTCLQTGEPLYFTHGDILDALLASTAIPGLFPPVELAGRQVIDGGIADNVPLGAAIERGADTVIAMLCICCDAIPYPVHGWWNILQHSLSIAIDRKYRSDLRHYHSKARLIVMEPRAGLDVGLLDFSRVGHLISLGYEHALVELKRNDLAPRSIPQPG